MEIEELKERYKVLPIWARLLTAVVIGLVPAVYVYLDEGDALAARLDEAAAPMHRLGQIAIGIAHSRISRSGSSSLSSALRGKCAASTPPMRMSPSAV